MTDITIATHSTNTNDGKIRAGRPYGPAARRSMLRMDFIKQIGIHNVTPVIAESILAATELTVMASETRKKLAKAGGGTAEDLMALVRLENSAARAVQRLGLPAPKGMAVHPESLNTAAAA